MVPWVGLQSKIVAFLGQSQLLFAKLLKIGSAHIKNGKYMYHRSYLCRLKSACAVSPELFTSTKQTNKCSNQKNSNLGIALYVF